MAHYQRAQGQPCCKFGAQCTRKQPGHWESYDHPHDHPRIVNAKKHIKQQDGPTLDRSRCALAGREGDEPNSAIYTCAGCGTKVEGFSRWRNHMKRAKRVGSSSVAPSGGQAAGKQASSTGSAIQSMAAHHEHEPAWAVPMVCVAEAAASAMALFSLPESLHTAFPSALPMRALGCCFCHTHHGHRHRCHCCCTYHWTSGTGASTEERTRE